MPAHDGALICSRSGSGWGAIRGAVMAERARRREAEAVLRIRGLHVYYGQSHALQGVDLDLPHGVVSVVGRNGMGKTTLCNAITGLVPVARGSVQFEGDELAGVNPSRIAHHGVGYVPQGRRLWPSLTVDEHLRLCQRGARGGWTRERIYETFPRLAERRASRGGQLSGGEQQMLAISRALLLNPRLLVMDEPTEGLAPVIVQQVEDMLIRIGEEGEVSVLVIEQNIGVATAVSDDVAIMVNGRIHRIMDAAALAADRDLQQRLLGVGRHGEEEWEADAAGDGVGAGSRGRPGGAFGAGVGVPGTSASGAPALRLVSGHGAGRTWTSNPEPPTRWSKPVPVADFESAAADLAGPRRPRGAGGLHDADGARYTGGARDADESHSRGGPRAGGARRAAGGRRAGGGQRAVRGAPLRPLSPEGDPVVLVIGTFDTKGAELKFVRDRIVEAGQRVKLVDVSTSGRPSAADVPPHQIAACHPKGPNAVFTNDRGTAVRGMAVALERWMPRQQGVAGVICAGGSGAAALVAPAMQALPVGVPKVMVSTVASGDVSRYVGASDVMMLYSVTDVQGLNAISRKVLANGAHALAGMVAARGDETSARARARARTGGRTAARQERPAVGLTMFGVTTTCVRQVCARLEDRYDCLVFHATGTGGRSMEKLLDSGELAGVLDVTTTEVCDLMMGGVLAATEDRFGAVIRTRAPFVGAPGALDMVNFGPRESVPERYRSRTLHEHNPQVTLMRTTAEENDRMGRWIGARLNLMDGPVRFLLPEGGVSQLDAPGMPFHDPAADAALFRALEETVRQTGMRQLVRLPHHVNDPAFADALAAAFEAVAGARTARVRGGR